MRVWAESGNRVRIRSEGESLAPGVAPDDTTALVLEELFDREGDAGSELAVERNAHRPLTVHDIAAHARLSTRTLNRRFREHTGTTPLQWVSRARIQHAQSLLETTRHTIERIAQQSGFGSGANFRATFRAAVGTSPAAYRATFTGSAPRTADTGG